MKRLSQLPPVNTKQQPKIGRSPFALPKFGFVPTKSNLFKLKKKTRSLFPHMYREKDDVLGYVGYLGAANKIQHNTFPRFAPRKLYINAGDTLLPPRKSSEGTCIRRLPKMKKKKRKQLRNPFHMNNPNCETIFLVTHEKHGKRPTLRYRNPPSRASP